MSTVQNKLKVLSLFSGCGGMDLGFEGGFEVISKSVNNNIHPDWISSRDSSSNRVKLPETNFTTVFANDILPAAKASWVPFFQTRGHEAKIFHLESIVDLVKKHNNNTNIFPYADVVTGGFPCQDFSVAGKRKGFDSHKAHHGSLLCEADDPSEENRGKLYVWMKRVVSIVQPKVFIAENVKGLVSLPHVQKTIEQDFSRVGGGYLVVEAKVLYAPDYGVPQSRERIFFIGLKRSALTKDATLALSQPDICAKYNPYPVKTHYKNSGDLFAKQNKLVPYVTVGDYLAGLPEPWDSNDASQKAYSKAKWYGAHCQGQTEVNLQGLGPTIRAEHHGNIEFRRLSAKHGGKNFRELNKGLQERRLSVRECARIQTFPDDFEFVRRFNVRGSKYKLSPSDGYRLVGNAVPPLLAFHVAWRLQELWSILFK